MSSMIEQTDVTLVNLFCFLPHGSLAQAITILPILPPCQPPAVTLSTLYHPPVQLIALFLPYGHPFVCRGYVPIFRQLERALWEKTV